MSRTVFFSSDSLVSRKGFSASSQVTAAREFKDDDMELEQNTMGNITSLCYLLWNKSHLCQNVYDRITVVIVRTRFI